MVSDRAHRRSAQAHVGGGGAAALQGIARPAEGRVVNAADAHLHIYVHAFACKTFGVCVRGVLLGGGGGGAHAVEKPDERALAGLELHTPTGQAQSP